MCVRERERFTARIHVTEIRTCCSWKVENSCFGKEKQTCYATVRSPVLARVGKKYTKLHSEEHGPCELIIVVVVIVWVSLKTCLLFWTVQGRSLQCQDCVRLRGEALSRFLFTDTEGFGTWKALLFHEQRGKEKPVREGCAFPAKFTTLMGETETNMVSHFSRGNRNFDCCQTAAHRGDAD